MNNVTSHAVDKSEQAETIAKIRETANYIDFAFESLKDVASIVEDEKNDEVGFDLNALRREMALSKLQAMVITFYPGVHDMIDDIHGLAKSLNDDEPAEETHENT